MEGTAALRERVRQLALAEPADATSAAFLTDAAGSLDEETVNWATAALERLGPPDVRSVSDLTARLRSGAADTIYWAATLLGRLGPAAAAAVPELVAKLEGPNLDEADYLAARERAVWALVEMGAAAREALPVLQACCQSPTPRLARLARAAVAAIQAEDAPAQN
jgi:hypothetical protein